MRTKRWTAFGLVEITSLDNRVYNIADLSAGDYVMVNNRLGDCMPYEIAIDKGTHNLLLLSVGNNKNIRAYIELDQETIDNNEVYRATLDETRKTTRRDVSLSLVLSFTSMIALVKFSEKILSSVLLMCAILLIVKSNMWRVR